MNLLRRIAPLLFAVGAAAPALAADPFVMVKPTPDGSTNVAFWILELESRPTGTTVAGLTLDQINEALEAGEAPWCAADVLTPGSFTSSSPEIRAEIREYLSGSYGNAFRATTNMTGRPLLAVVGNARTCQGRVVPFLLLVDTGTSVPRVFHSRTFDDWTPFIALRADGNRLVVSSCLECDHAEVLSYNRRTRRFSWRSEGL